MRELALAGLIALGFGLGAFYMTGELGGFGTLNLVGGGLALLAAGAASARRFSFAGGAHSRRVVAFGLLRVVVALALAVGLERAAAWAHIRMDWTLEQRFELSPAVQRKLVELPQPVRATLFYDPLDPRVRRTRLLLREMQRVAGDKLELRERVIAEHPEEADLYEVASSNSVVLELGGAFETVGRPSEGTLFEGLYHLHGERAGRIWILRGDGEGDPNQSDELGFAGFAAALATEGYQVETKVSASLREIPPDVAAVIAIAPRRQLLPGALAALRRYLENGGSLVALLEPDTDTGLEALLSEWGIEPLRGIVVDPASQPIQDGGHEGIDIVASNYETQPLTRGLDQNRMTYFPGARGLALHKPRVEDDLDRAVLSSHRGFVLEDRSQLGSELPDDDGRRTDYQTLAASGRYSRDGGETRIVVFGDADFASNRWLRALYNLDLAMNSVHWAAEREPAMTLRPKVRSVVQFPLPLASSVQAFYGVGLLLPELLLIAGGFVWLRRRTA
jgi:hypothetical protein